MSTSIAIFVRFFYYDNAPRYFSDMFHGSMKSISETKICKIFLLMVQTKILGVC